MIDLFILHADVPAETSFVHDELVPALGLAPDRMRLSSELPLGGTVIGALEEGVARSRVTVAVVSPSFLTSTWAVFGETLASHVAVTGGLLVPVMLVECRLPLRLDLRVRLDCRDPLRRPGELERLRELVAQLIAADAARGAPGPTDVESPVATTASPPASPATTIDHPRKRSHMLGAGLASVIVAVLAVYVLARSGGGGSLAPLAEPPPEAGIAEPPPEAGIAAPPTVAGTIDEPPPEAGTGAGPAPGEELPASGTTAGKAKYCVWREGYVYGNKPLKRELCEPPDCNEKWSRATYGALLDKYGCELACECSEVVP